MIGVGLDQLLYLGTNSPAPYVPPTDSSLEFDTSNFDKAFLTMDTNLKRESVPPDAQEDVVNKMPSLNDSAFAVYDFVDKHFLTMECENYASTDLLDQSVIPADQDACLSPHEQDRESVESDSDSASTTISSLDSVVGLGSPVMQGIPEEGEGDISTETATTHRAAQDEDTQTYRDQGSRETTAAMLQRIQNLASDPGVKSSIRHSRDTTRASIDHIPQDSVDDWTILDAEPGDQAPNGRTINQPLSARGVVDMYRLALSKRRGTALRKKPSWRSPSSSLVFGRAGGNAKGNDSGNPSPGFLTPLSPSLAEIKIRLKNRKRKPATKKSSSPGASTPVQALGNESSDESGIHYSGGATPARHALSKSANSRGTSDGK